MMKNTSTEILTKEEKEILQVFKNVIPELSPIEKARLLGLGEGMAIKTQILKEKTSGKIA